jgi:hypothetical protein
MLRNRLIGTSAYFLAPPDGPAAGATASPTSSGSSPPSTPSGGVTTTTPSVAPGVEPPPAAPSEAPGTSADPTSDFMSIFDGPSEPSTVFPGSQAAAPAVTPPPAPTPAAAVPPTPAPTATPADGQQPTVAQPAGPGDGGQQPGGTPPPSGQSPVLDPYDPAGLARAIQANEQHTIDYVAQSMFQLTQEEAQALESDVLGTVPKLFAKAFVRSQVNQLMQLANIIPEMVRRATSDMRNHSQNEDAFYAKWPQIDRAKHGDLVKRFGITYRQLNPTVSRDEMIEHVGQLVLMAAKLPTTVSPAAGTPQGQVQNGAARAAHQPSPFTPAIPGPAATVQQPELSAVEAMFQPRD